MVRDGDEVLGIELVHQFQPHEAAGAVAAPRAGVFLHHGTVSGQRVVGIHRTVAGGRCVLVVHTVHFRDGDIEGIGPLAADGGNHGFHQCLSTIDGRQGIAEVLVALQGLAVDGQTVVHRLHTLGTVVLHFEGTHCGLARLHVQFGDVAHCGGVSLELVAGEQYLDGQVVAETAAPCGAIDARTVDVESVGRGRGRQQDGVQGLVCLGHGERIADIDAVGWDGVGLVEQYLGVVR